MKNKMGFVLIAAALCLLLFTGCGENGGNAGTGSEGLSPAASPSDTVSAGVAGNEQDYISKEEAKAAALSHAGLAENEVQFLSVYLDYDDGRAEYDVEFLKGNEEYDYSIDALTGEVLSMDREAEYLKSGDGSGEYIGEAAAQETALNHAGVTAENATFVHTSLDHDDGRWQYEVEFYANGTEYDYDIDALTGEILSFDHDAEFYTPQSGSANGTPVTFEQACQIALEHAGVAQSDAQHMQYEQDYDDGR